MTTPKELRAQLFQMIFAKACPKDDDKASILAERMFTDFRDEILEMAARKCDEIEEMLDNGTITKEEDPTWS